MSKVNIQLEMIKSLFSQLKTKDLEDLLHSLTAIISNRKRGQKQEQESILLGQLNKCNLPEADLKFFLELRTKRQKSELSPKELNLYFSLLEQEQKLQVKRIHLLKKIADLKEISVPQLMKQLEITAPASV